MFKDERDFRRQPARGTQTAAGLPEHQETPMAERRQHPRKKVTQPVAVMDHDREALLGYLVDISLSGFMLLCSTPLEINRVFQLGLELPPACGGQSVRLGAESLWRENSNDPGKYWAGFQIIDISPENLERIKRLMDDYL